eukprot:6281551-Pyramimonas_sp.AAC.1
MLRWRMSRSITMVGVVVASVSYAAVSVMYMAWLSLVTSRCCRVLSCGRPQGCCCVLACLSALKDSMLAPTMCKATLPSAVHARA